MSEFGEVSNLGTWGGYAPRALPEIPEGTGVIGVDPRLGSEDGELLASDTATEDAYDTGDTSVLGEVVTPEFSDADEPVPDLIATGPSGGDVPSDGPDTAETASDAPEPFGVDRFDTPEYAAEVPVESAVHAEHTAALLGAHEPYVDYYETVDGDHTMVALEHRTTEGTVYVKATSTNELRMDFVPNDGAPGSSHTYRADADGVVRRYDDFTVPQPQTAAEQLGGDHLVLSTTMLDGKPVGASELGYVQRVAEAAAPTRVELPDVVDAIMVGSRPSDGRLVEDTIPGGGRSVEEFERIASELAVAPAQGFEQIETRDRMEGVTSRRTTLGAEDTMADSYINIRRWDNTGSIVGASMTISVTGKARRPDTPKDSPEAYDTVVAGKFKPSDFPYFEMHVFSAWGKTQPYVACDLRWGSDPDTEVERFNVSPVAARLLRNYLRQVS